MDTQQAIEQMPAYGFIIGTVKVMLTLLGMMGVLSFIVWILTPRDEAKRNAERQRWADEIQQQKEKENKAYDQIDKFLNDQYPKEMQPVDHEEISNYLYQQGYSRITWETKPKDIKYPEPEALRQYRIEQRKPKPQPQTQMVHHQHKSSNRTTNQSEDDDTITGSKVGDTILKVGAGVALGVAVDEVVEDVIDAFNND